MAQIDTSDVTMMDVMLGIGDAIGLTVFIDWDAMAMAHRVSVYDSKTGNDASRIIPASVYADGKVSTSMVAKLMPQMIEEVIVLNKLMGPK